MESGWGKMGIMAAASPDTTLSLPPTISCKENELTVILSTLSCGGAERIVLDWAERIYPAWRVHLIVVNEVPVEYEVPSYVRITRVQKLPALNDARFVDIEDWHKKRYAQLAWLGREIARLTHPVAVCHLLNGDERSALAQAGVRVVTVLHNAKEGWGTSTAEIQHSSLVVAVSDACREDLARAGYRLPVSVIRHIPPTRSYDPDVRDIFRQTWKIPEDALVIGMIGTVRPQKNYPFALEVLKALHVSHDAYLVIVGGPVQNHTGAPAWSELQIAIERMGLSHRVVLTGTIPDAASCLPAFDVMLNTSHFEGLSIATLEALESGRGVVASRVGGQGEISDPRLKLMDLSAPSTAWADAILDIKDAPPHIPKWAGFESYRLWTLAALAHDVNPSFRRLYWNTHEKRGGVENPEDNTMSSETWQHIFVWTPEEHPEASVPPGAYYEIKTGVWNESPFAHAERLVAHVCANNISEICVGRVPPRVLLLVVKALAHTNVRIMWDSLPDAHIFQEASLHQFSSLVGYSWEEMLERILLAPQASPSLEVLPQSAKESVFSVHYSVIIPTRNRAKSLETCLRALAGQTLHPQEYEVIVVNDGSTDETSAVVARMQSSCLPQVVEVYQEHGGCAAARNTGILKAKGDILFFTDDDCIPPPEWMETLLRGFTTHPEAVGVGGWYAFSPSQLARNPFARVCDMEQRLGLGAYESYSIYSNTYTNPCGNTANLAYRRSLFDRVGMFDAYTKKTAMIDQEFKLRVFALGLPLLYVPMVIPHVKQIGWREFFAKPWRYGMADEYFMHRFEQVQPRPTWSNLLEHLASARAHDPRTSTVLFGLYLVVRICAFYYARRKRREYPTVISYMDTERFFTQVWQSGLTISNHIVRDGVFEEGAQFQSFRRDIRALLSTPKAQPVVSVVIPVYNRASFLTEEFALAFNRLEGHDQAIEIIFVDDGSTDDSPHLLGLLAKQIRFPTSIIRQNNAGPGSARNAGIRIARGRYIAFTDSDVLVTAEWLVELLVPFFYDDRVVASGGMQMNKFPLTVFDVERPHDDHPLSRRFYVGNQFVQPPYDSANLCIRPDLLKERGLLYFDESFGRTACEDVAYLLAMRAAGLQTAFVPVCVINLRSATQRDFFSLCLSRAEGDTRIRHLFAHLKPMMPRFFYPTNGYLLLSVLLSFRFWKVMRASPPLQQCIWYVRRGGTSGFFYQVIDALMRRQSSI